MSLAADPAPAQQSATFFDAPVLVADALSRFDLVLDLNGDTYADAVDWWWPASSTFEEVRVSGWINDQSGELVKTWTVLLTMPDPNNARDGGSGAGDLDGDNLADFALAFGPDIYAFSSNGAAAPSQIAGVIAADNIEDMLLADFDGDGLDDIAVSANGSVELHMNQGRILGFGLSDSFLMDGEAGLWLGEVNADGLPDLMNVKAHQVIFHEIVGGQLVNQFAISHNLGGPEDTFPLLGDIDGDGDDDVIVFRYGQYRLFRRTGPTSFSVEPLTPGGPATMLVDLDGDGDLDGACCSSGGSGVGSTTLNMLSSFFELSINDGSGAFALAYAIETVGSAGRGLAGVADLDHDGDMDLVSGRTIYYASGSGLGAPRHTDITDGALYDLHAVDVDGDGDIDFSYDDDDFIVNHADGSFDLVLTDIADPPGNKQWRGPGYPGDFDGDGDTDLLLSMVTGTFSNPVFWSMRLLENNGVGALFDAGDAADPSVFMNVSGLNKWWDDPKDAVVADVDGDGDLDMISRSFNTLQSKIFLNDGSGFFTAGQVFSEDTVQAVADLDGDATPDLVLSGGQLAIRIGLGGGAFGERINLPSSSMMLDDVVGCGDLDADGDIDLAVADRLTDAIALHYNDGAGNFSTDTSSLAGYITDDTFAPQRRTFIVDVDNDGRNDLLVTSPNNSGNGCYIFRQLANGSLDEPVIQIMRPSTLADVDGDGDLDAIVDDFSTNNNFPNLLSRVMDNLTFDEPVAGRVLQYGASKPGTGGQAPVMGASGPLRVGETVTVHVTGAQAGNLGIVVLGIDQTALTNTPWLDVTSYTWPWVGFFVLPAFGDGVLAGDGWLDLPYVVEASFPAVGPIYAQAIFADSAAPAGRTYTNGLLLEHE
jgi:hypothetical protein